jgi:hypothetical protein
VPESKGTTVSSSLTKINPLALASSTTNFLICRGIFKSSSVHTTILPATFCVSNDPG